MLEVRPNDPKKKISARHTLSLSLENKRQAIFLAVHLRLRKSAAIRMKRLSASIPENRFQKSVEKHL